MGGHNTETVLAALISSPDLCQRAVLTLVFLFFWDKIGSFQAHLILFSFPSYFYTGMAVPCCAETIIFCIEVTCFACANGVRVGFSLRTALESMRQ